MAGRPPSPESVAMLQDRYRSLMVCSPEEVRVYVGMKHSPPFVEDAVKQAVADGATRLSTLVPRPLHSKSGVGWYQHKVRKALVDMGVSLPVLDVDHWYRSPEFVALLADRLRASLHWLPLAVRAEAAVIFTAHSHPRRAVESGDPFAAQFQELAMLVANAVGLERWELAYRGAGHQAEQWLGPDVKEVVRAAGERGRRAVVLCELLSVTDNVEVIYDAGFDCRSITAEFGMAVLEQLVVDQAATQP
jgi:ferrochelatase